MPQHSRNVAADEICTLLGAFGGFVGVAWPLLCSTSYDAPLEGKPTAISGLAALLLAWCGALVGAIVALVLVDALACCAFHASRGRNPRRTLDGRPVSETLSINAPYPISEASREGEQPCAQPETLDVVLASNGARPDMRARVDAFVSDVVAARGGGAEEEMLVAAGGPKALLSSLRAALPSRLRMVGLTHPM